jgi:hypothetical protein
MSNLSAPQTRWFADETRCELNRLLVHIQDTAVMEQLIKVHNRSLIIVAAHALPNNFLWQSNLEIGVW